MTFFLAEDADSLLEIDKIRGADMEALQSFLAQPGAQGEPSLAERLQALFQRVEREFLPSPTGLIVNRKV